MGIELLMVGYTKRNCLLDGCFDLLNELVVLCAIIEINRSNFPLLSLIFA